MSNEHPYLVDAYFDDVTISYTPSPIVSGNDYFPFGLTYNSYARENSVKQDYQYNSKELQDEMGLSWLDYGARMYMADIGRWGAVDPLAEQSRRWSPYTYAMNNPMRFIDPDGMTAEESLSDWMSRKSEEDKDRGTEHGMMMRVANQMETAGSTERQQAKSELETTSTIGEEPDSDQTQGDVVLDVNGNVLKTGTGDIYVNVDGRNIRFHDNLVQDGTMTADAFGNGLLNIVSGIKSTCFDFDKSKLYHGKFSVAIRLRDGKKVFSSNGGRIGGISTGTRRAPDGSYMITYYHINGKLTVDKVREQLGVHEYYGHLLQRLTQSADHEAIIKMWVNEYLSDPNR